MCTALTFWRITCVIIVGCLFGTGLTCFVFCNHLEREERESNISLLYAVPFLLTCIDGQLGVIAITSQDISRGLGSMSRSVYWEKQNLVSKQICCVLDDL